MRALVAALISCAVLVPALVSFAQWGEQVKDWNWGQVDAGTSDVIRGSVYAYSVLDECEGGADSLQVAASGVWSSAVQVGLELYVRSSDVGHATSDTGWVAVVDTAGQSASDRPSVSAKIDHYTAYQDTLGVRWSVYQDGALVITDSKLVLQSVRPDVMPATLEAFALSTPDSTELDGNWTGILDIQLSEASDIVIKFAASEAGLAAADTQVLATSSTSYAGIRDTGVPLDDLNAGLLYAELSVTDACGNTSTGNTSMLVERRPYYYAYNVLAGASYWLPDDVTQTAYSGIGGGEYFDDPIGDYAVIWRGWDWYEPTSPGTYWWTGMDNMMANNAALGKTVEIRPVTGSRTSSEAAFYHVPDHYESYLTEVQLPSTGRYVANVWHPTVAAAYNAFISALGARYADDPRLESITIHGLSNSAGDEFTFEPATDLQAMADEWFSGDTDLLMEAMQGWIEDRMDAYAAAFAGYEHKVVWTGHDGDKWSLFMPAAWDTMNRDLIDYAISLGFGVRGGIHTKNLTSNLFNTTFGFSVDSSGRQLVDDSGDQFDGRYLGEETEAVYGDDPSDTERLRLSVYRGLQMRANHIYITTDPDDSTDTYTMAPDLWEYARLGLGKTASTSPDAWCVLWEQDLLDTYPPLQAVGAGEIKNYERWLVQSDLPGGVTTATEFHASTNGGAGFGYEVAPYGFYTARSTDTTTSNTRMFFAADDSFALDRPLTIMVETVDSEDATWAIDYADEYGDSTRTDPYTSAGDDSIRTVAFTINGITRGGLDNGQDFAITRTDGGDVVVRMVRLIDGAYGSIDYDTTPPTIVSFSVSGYDSSGSGGAYRAFVSAEIGESALLRVRSGTTPISVLSADWDTLSSAWTAGSDVHDTGIQPYNGTLYMQASAIDAAGNEATATDNEAVARAVDLGIPDLTFVSITYDEDTETVSGNVTSDEPWYISYRHRYDTDPWSSSAVGDTLASDQTVVVDVSGVADDTVVEIEVGGDDAEGNSATPVSDTVTVVRGSDAPSAPTGLVATISDDVEAPDKPTGESAVAGVGEIAVTWNANTEPDLSHYYIYRGTTSGSLTRLPMSLLTPEYDDTDLVDGVTYYYAITAVDDKYNESVQSDETSAVAVVADTTPPAAPTGLAATISGDTTPPEAPTGLTATTQE